MVKSTCPWHAGRCFFMDVTLWAQKCKFSEKILYMYICKGWPRRGGKTSMSIIEGWYNGRRVFADEGEELRRKDVLCIHCGAKMHVKLFPNETDRYHFVLQNGEVHRSVCQAYDGKKSAPVLTNISPEELIAMLSKNTEKRLGGALVTIIIRGKVDAVTAAVESGELKSKSLGKVYGKAVIARPHDEIMKFFDIEE
jgi:hypothetical protein